MSGMRLSVSRWHEASEHHLVPTVRPHGVDELVSATTKYTGDDVDEVLMTVSLFTTFFGMSSRVMINTTESTQR